MVTIHTHAKDPDGYDIKLTVDSSKYHWGMDEIGVWYHEPDPRDKDRTRKITVPWTTIDWVIEA